LGRGMRRSFPSEENKRRGKKLLKGSGAKKIQDFVRKSFGNESRERGKKSDRQLNSDPDKERGKKVIRGTSSKQDDKRGWRVLLNQKLARREE